LWLEHPEKLAKVSSASKNLARPEATRQIARLIASQVFMPTQNRLLLPSTQV